jgi:hypothetical protein
MRLAAVLLVLAGLVAAERVAFGVETDLYTFDPGGRIEAARAADLDRDGRQDLILLVTRLTPDRGERQELVTIRAPRAREPEAFWKEAKILRLPLDQGPAEGAGAVAVGAFGPSGEMRFRFFAADGLRDVTPEGRFVPPDDRAKVPTLLARSPGRPIVFWDGHADLDGDGIEECWFPTAEGSGRVHLQGGKPGLDRTLSLDVFNRSATDGEFLFIRYARVPRMVPADLDGDGKYELIAWDGEALVSWSLDGGSAPLWRVPLPLDKPNLGPDEVYTPRLQIADVDGDHRADLLVTIVTGNRTHIGSFRTRLYHFPGPFYDPETKTIAPPTSRIDTESVALHPRFVDLDGDGTLDYLCDSIRGTKTDLILRVLGQEPTVWHAAYLYRRDRGAFDTEPVFSVERPYSREEAVSNHFGISAFFSGDFNGDGLKDMLDLGNLMGFEILGAFRKSGERPGDPVSFTQRLLPRVRVEEPLAADAVVADFDGNGLADGAVWGAGGLRLVMSRRTP